MPFTKSITFFYSQMTQLFDQPKAIIQLSFADWRFESPRQKVESTLEHYPVQTKSKLVGVVSKWSLDPSLQEGTLSSKLIEMLPWNLNKWQLLKKCLLKLKGKCLETFQDKKNQQNATNILKRSVSYFDSRTPKKLFCHAHQLSPYNVSTELGQNVIL